MLMVTTWKSDMPCMH